MTPVFASTRSQQTERLQWDFENKLPKFQGRTVEARLDRTYWFSNEYPVGSSYQYVRLFDSFARIPFPKPLSEYRVAVLTGEGGIFCGFSALAANSDMILQIDCDPLALQFSACLLAELRSLDTFTDKNQVLENAIKRFQSINPDITERQIKTIREQFEEYTVNMSGNLFTDRDNFRDFKHFQDHPVVQVRLNYFSETDMDTFIKILRDNGAVVHFLNVSNVCEYPKQFYVANPFRGEVTGIHPARYMLKLPFSGDAVCAYSQLFGFLFFTAVCSVAEMEEHLHATAINRRDRDLKKLAKDHHDPLEQYLHTALEVGEREFKLTTKIFLFLAKHANLANADWMLRLTAARLTAEEIQELKVNRHLIETLYLENQVQQPVAQVEPPLLFKILDKVLDDTLDKTPDKPSDQRVTEPASAETEQSMDCATTSQTFA